MSSDSTSLHAMWFQMLPEWFAAMQPPLSKSSASANGFFASSKSAETSSLGEWWSAMQGGPALAEGMLTQLYNAWIAWLPAQGPRFDVMMPWDATSLEASFRPIFEAFSGTNLGGGSAFGLPPGDAWTAPFNPLRVGAERTFGALAEAFGMKSLRDVQESWQGLITAEADQRVAQLAYLGLLSKAWAEGTKTLTEKLESMRAQGEQLESFLAFVHLWMREIDQAGHIAMQSEEGLAVTARAVRASNRQRAERQRLVALVSEALNVPTRAEVDDGFREIQELKREIRHLKRSLNQSPRVESTSQPAMANGASSQTETPPSKTPPRRNGRNGKRTHSGTTQGART
jgi:hypothetical protein